MKFTDKERQVLNKAGGQIVSGGVTYKNINNVIVGSDGSRKQFQKPPVTNVAVAKLTPGSLAANAVNLALSNVRRSRFNPLNNTSKSSTQTTLEKIDSYLPKSAAKK